MMFPIPGLAERLASDRMPTHRSQITSSSGSSGGTWPMLIATLTRLPIAIFYMVCFLLSLGFFFMVFSLVHREKVINESTKRTLLIFEWGLIAYAVAAILLVICVITYCILRLSISNPTSRDTPPPSLEDAWDLPPN